MGKDKIGARTLRYLGGSLVCLRTSSLLALAPIQSYFSSPDRVRSLLFIAVEIIIIQRTSKTIKDVILDEPSSFRGYSRFYSLAAHLLVSLSISDSFFFFLSF